LTNILSANAGKLKKKLRRAEFERHVGDLLGHPELLRLDEHTHHYYGTRLSHSLSVAYKSYRVAAALGLDSRSAARGGLLHDLCYHRHNGFWHDLRMLFRHPKDALANAGRSFTLNRVEKNIILRHMWLVTPIPPKYAEGYIVTFVDKYCAAAEFIKGTARKLKRKVS
jgi:uncharacterized protein